MNSLITGLTVISEITWLLSSEEMKGSRNLCFPPGSELVMFVCLCYQEALHLSLSVAHFSPVLCDVTVLWSLEQCERHFQSLGVSFSLLTASRSSHSLHLALNQAMWGRIRGRERDGDGGKISQILLTCGYSPSGTFGTNVPPSLLWVCQKGSNRM